MSNVSAKKVFIQIESAEEQQEHLKNQRKTLKVLQSVGTDKENLTGRQQHFDKLTRIKASADITLASLEHGKRKKVETRAIETQTSPEKQVPDAVKTITEEDLTSTSKPGEHYFEKLAEKRREALENTLAENQTLHERIEGLEEELNTTRQMLEETKSLVEVLTEMLDEKDNADKDPVKDDDSDTRSSFEGTAEEQTQKSNN